MAFYEKRMGGGLKSGRPQRVLSSSRDTTIDDEQETAPEKEVSVSEGKVFHEARVRAHPKLLENWLDYINWAEKCAPEGVSTIREQCGLALLEDERVKNDERYVRVWLSEASHVENPEHIFELLDSRGIGQALSLFWVAWAFVAEKAERFAVADQIYSRGAAADAQPAELLRRRRREFERRMKRRYIQAADSSSSWSKSTTKLQSTTRAPFRPLDTQLPPETAAKRISRKLVFSTAKRHDQPLATTRLRRADDQDLTINSSIAQKAIDDLFHERTTTYDEATVLAGEQARTDNCAEDDIATVAPPTPCTFDIYVDDQA